MKVLVPALASVMSVAHDEPGVCGFCGRTDPDATGMECDGHTNACPECQDEHIAADCGVCTEIAVADAAAELAMNDERDERWDL